jgi:hypothetical protein
VAMIDSRVFAGLLAALSAQGVACGERPLEAIELMPTTLTQGLLAYWSFDEGQGSSVADRSGNQRNGVLTGGTWILDGRFGGALRLEENQFVSVAAFPDATASYSVSAWVRLITYVPGTPNDEDTHWATILSAEALGSGGWELGIDRFTTPPGLHFGFFNGPNYWEYGGDTCSCLELGRWIQFAGVVDDSSLTFSVYVDGQPFKAPQAITHPLLPGSPTLTMGQTPSGGRFLSGDVDDIAVWNRALVPSEVTALTEHPPSASR